MKNTKKYIIVSAALALAMVVFAVILIMYDKGVFDISFIKRADPVTGEETGAGPDTETDTETAPPDGTDTDGETTDIAEETADQSVFDKLHENIPAVNGKLVTPTEKTYDGQTMSLYRFDAFKLPENNLGNDYMTRTKYVVTRDGVKRTITENTVRELRRTVDVYMGMLVISDGKSLTFYDGTGTQLYEYTGESELVFAYERDSEDRPLFMFGSDYYYIDTVNKTLVKSDFEKGDGRGLRYNYPTTFGKDAEKAKFSAYSGLYPVAQKDEGGIGSVYYDGGYVMARSIKHERDDDEDGKVVEDTEVIVNEDGKRFPLPEGYSAKAYSDQRILVEYKGKYGFYAIKGAWIADSKYTYATPYHEGLAVVGGALQKGVIDMDGNFVIPMSYSSISVCSGGIIVCWSTQTGYEVYIKAEN